MTKQRLYRPVGLKELILILDTDATAYPPRLDWQPIFYPVLNFDYAAQIASDWNTKDAASDYVGYVTTFEIDSDFLKQYQVQNVGGHRHDELWVPSEDLALFNQHIDGCIQVVTAFYGQNYQGNLADTIHFKGMDIHQQWDYLLANKSQMAAILKTEKNTVIANYWYWKQRYLSSYLNEIGIHLKKYIDVQQTTD